MYEKSSVRTAFTLIELLVVVAIIALLVSILLPSLARAREASKRVVCAQNLKSLNTACKTYAHDHNGAWPGVASFQPPVQYPEDENLDAMGGTGELPRNRESRNVNEPGMSTAVSPTRSLWLLLRQGQVSGKSFICPSSNEDQQEEQEDVASFYDFKGYNYLSYGYQISTMTKWNPSAPRENRDPRMVFLADKNPGIVRNTTQAHEDENGPNPDIPGFNSDADFSMMNKKKDEPPYNGEILGDLERELYLPFNSPNHGGRDEGEGQNISRSDGSTEFARTPLAGVDRDNVYSSQRRSPTPPWTKEKNLYMGYWPGRKTNSIVPGYRSFPDDKSSTTDTMVFP